MTFKAKVASALSFAHLAGLGRGKAAAAAEDDDKKDRDHEDGDVKKAKKAEADEPEDDKEKKDGGQASAEDDEPDSKADADEPDEDDGKKDKKDAKADDGYDDKEDEMRGKSAAAQARLREQARCAAIFASPAAAHNPVLAANLAFKTRMGRKEALAVLDATPAAATAVFARPGRAAANPRVGAGGESTVTGKQAVDSSWDRAFSKVTPQKRR